MHLNRSMYLCGKNIANHVIICYVQTYYYNIMFIYGMLSYDVQTTAIYLTSELHNVERFAVKISILYMEMKIFMIL